jgi:hypothetical protein
MKLTKPMRDCLETTEWGMTHFGGIVTNRQLPLAAMRKCVDAGLCKCIGLVSLCDGDCFTIYPERFRLGYVLTAKGKRRLRLERDVLNDHAGD